MATVGNTVFTLMDVARRTQNQAIAKIIEVLHDTNEILQDIPFMPCNDGDSHITTIRTGLPTVAWKRFNYGVQSSKSQTQQIEEATGLLMAYSKIDKQLAEKNGNVSDVRASEDVAFLEAMNQEHATTLFYGNAKVDPEKFNGFATRFYEGQTTVDKTKIGRQLIDGGGSGADNTSIWLIGWGEFSVFGLYPKGEMSGFKHEDMGIETETVSGRINRYYMSEYSWRTGLCVRDWRYIARICNIDVSELGDAGESTYNGAAVLQLMIKAIHRLPKTKLARRVFYMNETVMEALDLISNFDSRLALKVEEVDGVEITSFRGIPVRECEAILDTESAVSFV